MGTLATVKGVSTAQLARTIREAYVRFQREAA